MPRRQGAAISPGPFDDPGDGFVNWQGFPPPYCHWSTELGRWACQGPPPDPWPHLKPWEYEGSEFGPAGTLYSWTQSDQDAYESAAGEALLKYLFRKFGKLRGPQGGGGYLWVVPPGPDQPATPVEFRMMRWIRTQIVGKIGNAEEVVHVHNWRHATVENQAADALAVKIVATNVRNAWAAFMATHKGAFSPDLTYVEVRGSLLEQANPGDTPTWPLPTQVVPFGAGVTGTGAQQTLPYEVAMCISLNTNFRGTSRFRGRTYLGPLNSGLLGSNGLFSANAVNPIGTGFGELFIAGVEGAGDYDLHVVSQKYGTSAHIQGARLGMVPDSQRRRRRDQVEAYTQVWGQPVGAN